MTKRRQKPKPKPKPVGRPPADQAKLDAICAMIAEGISLRKACSRPGMPTVSTVLLRAVKDKAFSEQYRRARLQQADVWFDEIADIADDGSNDWMERQTRSGETIAVLNHEHVTRSKLRIDARLKIIALMNPKKYGEKLDVNQAGTLRVKIVHQ